MGQSLCWYLIIPLTFISGGFSKWLLNYLQCELFVLNIKYRACQTFENLSHRVDTFWKGVQTTVPSLCIDTVCVKLNSNTFWIKRVSLTRVWLHTYSPKALIDGSYVSLESGEMFLMSHISKAGLPYVSYLCICYLSCLLELFITLFLPSTPCMKSFSRKGRPIGGLAQSLCWQNSTKLSQFTCFWQQLRHTVFTLTVNLKNIMLYIK